MVANLKIWAWILVGFMLNKIKIRKIRLRGRVEIEWFVRPGRK